MSAALALQGALVAELKGDAALTGLLGGPHVHDGAPQGAGFPHVALGDVTSLDWDAGEDAGEEHSAVLVVRSRTGGRRQALEIVGAIVAVLDEAPLTLPGHRLVNCRIEATDTRRESDGKTWRGRVRLRAVTEAG